MQEKDKVTERHNTNSNCHTKIKDTATHTHALISTTVVPAIVVDDNSKQVLDLATFQQSIDLREDPRRPERCGESEHPAEKARKSMGNQLTAAHSSSLLPSTPGFSSSSSSRYILITQTLSSSSSTSLCRDGSETATAATSKKEKEKVATKKNTDDNLTTTKSNPLSQEEEEEEEEEGFSPSHFFRHPSARATTTRMATTLLLPPEASGGQECTQSHHTSFVTTLPDRNSIPCSNNEAPSSNPVRVDSPTTYCTTCGSSSIFSPSSTRPSSSSSRRDLEPPSHSCRGGLMLPALCEAAAETSARPHTPLPSSSSSETKHTTTPKNFLQLTPRGAKERSEGRPLSQARQLRAEHQDHISSLVPIIANVLCKTIDSHHAALNEDDDDELSRYLCLPDTPPAGEQHQPGEGNVLLKRGATLPGMIEDDDEEEEDSEEQKKLQRKEKHQTRRNPRASAEDDQQHQPEFITYETFGIEDAPTLKQYLNFFMNNAWSSSSSFVGALVLMDRYFEKHPKFRLTFRNAFKFFVCCSRVASKTIETITCRNKTFAGAARLCTESLNDVEAVFLREMNFEVAVLKSDWQRYADQILKGLLQEKA